MGIKMSRLKFYDQEVKLILERKPVISPSPRKVTLADIVERKTLPPHLWTKKPLTRMELSVEVKIVTSKDADHTEYALLKFKITEQDQLAVFDELSEEWIELTLAELYDYISEE
jgi:hypothetical protein